jgi:SAM-dependent methyltransferase
MMEDRSPYQTYRGWEYAKTGDYHRLLDPKWSYTPTYLRKMRFVRREIQRLSLDARVLDAGCGEGLLVEEFRAKGRPIIGLDQNYESEYVLRGSILDMPFKEDAFDLVLLLDVFEHLSFADQPKALAQIRRVLAEGGQLIASIPNLAHLNSRFYMLFFGRLDRTDSEDNHVGERPAVENHRLLMDAGFEIDRVKGITLTIPIVYRLIICHWPDRFRWLHDLLEPLAIPSLAMLDVFVCRNRKEIYPP